VQAVAKQNLNPASRRTRLPPGTEEHRGCKFFLTKDVRAFKIHLILDSPGYSAKEDIYVLVPVF